jgi:hypothetical protein
MTGGIDLEIRERLGRYLSRDISLHDFQSWFVPVLWNIEQTQNAEAIELAGEIELRLAEFSNGDWTEAELRSKLEPLVSMYRTELIPLPQRPDAYFVRSSLHIQLASHGI